MPEYTCHERENYDSSLYFVSHTSMQFRLMEREVTKVVKCSLKFFCSISYTFSLINNSMEKSVLNVLKKGLLCFPSVAVVCRKTRNEN